MSEDKVKVTIVTKRKNSESIIVNTFDVNNLLTNINEWLTLLGFHLDIIDDGEMKLTSDDPDTTDCYMEIYYPKELVVCSNYEKNILNGNIDWQHALDDDLFKNSICSPEYILSRKSTTKEIFKCKLPFDMASLLLLLYYRKSNILIPEYHTIKNSKINDNQVIIDTKNRKGKILSLVSNASTFNFSVRILDTNVKEIKNDGKEIVGFPRTFTLTDSNGELSENWKNFQFVPEDQESEFFKDILAYTKNTVPFDMFVNKEKAQCFYTDWYYNMKVAIHRLTQEKKYLQNMLKKYKEVNENTDSKIINNVSHKKKETNEPKQKSESVLCFECIVDEPIISFSYINESMSPELIRNQIYETMNGINSKLEFYRFVTRMIECAWTKINPYDSDMKPLEFKIYGRYDVKWENDLFKFPGKRIEWFKCNLSNGKSLYCRYFFKQIKQKEINEE